GPDDRGELRSVGGAGDGSHQLQRSAEAGPEPLDEHLVASVGSGRGAGGIGAVVSHSLPHREERHAEGHQDGQDAERVDDAVTLDAPGPGKPPRGSLGDVGPAPGERGALPAGQGPQDEALSMSDRILVMNGGRILREGTPEEVYRQPGRRFVAEFLGQCNFLTGAVSAGPDGGAVLRTAEFGDGIAVPGAQAGPSGTIAIRPEDIEISAMVPSYAPGAAGA